MKSKLFILQFLAAVVLTSCSNEESVIDKPDTSKDANYLAVKIVTPGSVGTRTAQEGDFEVGADEENKAEKGLFLIFDASGNPIQTPQEVDLTWTDGRSETPAIEKISNAIVTIAGNTTPEKALVILNAPADLNLANMSLAEVRKTIGDYSAATEGTFIITNSTYDGDGGDATVIAGQTYPTKDEAIANPVNFYVERVVAKIRTKAIDDTFTLQGGKITVDGSEVTLTQTIEGIEIANIAEKSYLFKSIDGNESWTWTKTGWNDLTNFRSYWATSPTDLTYKNQTWNAITEKVDDSHTFYVQENTSDIKTSVLVTATLKKDNQPYSFVRWAGNYYSKNGFLSQYAQILKNTGYQIREANTYRDIKVDDLTWITADEHAEYVEEKKLKGYEMTAKLNNETTKDFIFVKGADNTASSREEVNNTLLEKENLVWLWEDGKCYYFANIEHFGPTTPFNEGVVRNHIYDLTFNSLTGIGIPVFNPEETIIPEQPEDELYYLAAKINILKWKLVEQTVDFK